MTTRLSAIAFDSYIANLTENFTGRQWVFDEIDRWLKESDERFFILTGEPGVGKSAIAAELIQRRNAHQDLTAYHFCIAGRAGTIEPDNVLFSIAAQLIKLCPGYAEALVNTIKPLHLSVNVEINIEKIVDSVVQGVVIKNLHTQHPKKSFDIILRQTLSALSNPPEQPILILIDSLDEAVTYNEEDNLVRLFSQVEDLPSWVRLVFTSRPDERRVLSHFQTLKPHHYDLDEIFKKSDKFSNKSLDDIRNYVEKRVKSELVQKQLKKYEILPVALCEQLTELSKGNFLYIKVLLDDIESGGQPLDQENLAKLPKSLTEFYHNFLIRRVEAEWEGKYQIIFKILTVTKAPITGEELEHLVSDELSATELKQRLMIVRQFLNVEQNIWNKQSYSLFHQSLRDYLVDGEKSGIFYCSQKDGHLKIVDYYWQYHPNDWHECDPYGLKYVASHFIDLIHIDNLSKNKQNKLIKLAGILTNFNYLETKTATINLHEVLNDLNQLLEIFPSELESKIHISSLFCVLNAQSNALRGWSKTQFPSFFAQQIYNCSKTMGLSHITNLAEQRLQQIAKPYLSLLWKASNESPELERTIGRHDGVVTALAITPDGNYIVSASAQGTLKLWNLRTGGEIYRFSGIAHDLQICALAITPDGQKLISAGWDKIVKVWDFNSGQLLRQFIGHSDWVTDLKITKDSRYIISASYDNTIRIWDLETEDVSVLNGHFGVVRGLELMHSDPLLVSVSDDGSINIWNLTGKELIKSIPFDDLSILVIALTSDDSHIVIVTVPKEFRDNTDWLIKSLQEEGLTPELSRQFAEESYICGPQEIYSLLMIDLNEEEIIFLDENVVGISDLLIDSANCSVIASSFDKTLKIYNWEYEEVEKVWIGHENRVNAIVITPDRKHIISAGDDTSLKIWNLRNTNLLPNHLGHSNWVRAVEITPNNKYGISLDSEGLFKIWELESGREVRKFDYLSSKKVSAKDNDDSEQLSDLQKIANLTTVSGVSISPNGLFVGLKLSVPDLEDESYSHFVKIINVQTQQGSMFICPESIWMTISHDGSKVVLADLEDNIFIFDSFSNSSDPQVRTLLATKDTSCISISPDGCHLITSSDRGIFQVWNIHSGETVFTHNACNSEFIYKAAFTSNSNHIVSNASDGSIKIWDFIAGVEQLSIPANDENILAIKAVNECPHVVAVGADYSLNIWDMESGNQLATAILDALAYSIAVTTNGEMILTGDRTGNVYCFRYVN